jgi:hypothetical protein
MAKRKTINVEELKDMINDQIAHTGKRSGKRSLYFALESILHETGNYKGFGWPNVSSYIVRSDSFGVGHPNYYDRMYY